MKNVYVVRNQYGSGNRPKMENGESVLTIPYEAYSEYNGLDHTQTKADRLMNGMELRDVDRIIYLACKHCRDHEKCRHPAGRKMQNNLNLPVLQFATPVFFAFFIDVPTVVERRKYYIHPCSPPKFFPYGPPPQTVQ